MLKSTSVGASADIISILKSEARLLHKAAEKGDAAALYRIRRESPAFAMGAALQRKQCLATIGRELGFASWKAARDCFLADDLCLYDAFLHPRRCHVYWNIWFADLKEARRVQARHGGYLLVYKTQFMVVDRDYIASLGVNPDSPAWEALDRDWTADGQAAKGSLIIMIIIAHMKAAKKNAHLAVAIRKSA